MKKPRSITLILGLLMLTCLLSACSSWFQPKTKTIEYDEQVKLHNGEMIWVHITRHYFYTSEPSSGGAYMPSTVEISWDTGFEGVGRKSVFFDEVIYSINKYNNEWYVLGAIANSSDKNIGNSINCRDVGKKLGEIGCLVIINKSGFSQVINNNTIHYNVLEPKGIKSLSFPPETLNGEKLSWDRKLILQESQSEDYRRMGKSYLIKSTEL